MIKSISPAIADGQITRSKIRIEESSNDEWQCDNEPMPCARNTASQENKPD
jgi:hypothetical protein